MRETAVGHVLNPRSAPTPSTTHVHTDLPPPPHRCFHFCAPFPERMQTNGKLLGPGRTASLLLKEAGVAGFYRGVLSPMVGTGLIKAAVFGGYGLCQSLVRKATGKGERLFGLGERETRVSHVRLQTWRRRRRRLLEFFCVCVTEGDCFLAVAWDCLPKSRDINGTLFFSRRNLIVPRGMPCLVSESEACVPPLFRCHGERLFFR